MNREESFVELVDRVGAPIGSATVAQAHAAPGQLHRAFSVLLFDDQQRLLLQQRAAGKTRFPMRWANTCCGHPAPGEDPVVAASRRLREELGIAGVSIAPIGVYVYRAEDPVTERVEHEYDHVLVGRLNGSRPDPDPDNRPDPDPDPAEVAAIRWAGPDEVLRAIGTEPWSYAPWLAGVVSVWRAAAAEPPGER
jgi:isopentenyl-diphosphate delta-isomerase